MSVEYMKEFMVLVEHMSFTSAAKQLNMTQSALSKHVSSLEREFNTSFFNREGNSISLTLQGRAFCEEALRIIAAYDTAQERIRHIQPPVIIGGSVHDSAVRSIVSAALRSFNLDEGRIEINVVPTTFQASTTSLLGNAIDLAITIALEDDTDNPQTKNQVFNRVPLVAAMERTHTLAHKKSLRLTDLANEGIMCPTGSLESTRGSRVVEDLFARKSIPIRKHIFYAKDALDFPYVNLEGNVFVMPQTLFNKQFLGPRMEDLVAIPFEDSDAFFPYKISWRADEQRKSVLTVVDALINESDLRHQRQQK